MAETNARQAMRIGEQAIVIGAGIAGLAAAAALADWFERVIILERDHLPDAATHRVGAPQSRHAHGLLVGGKLALEELFPRLDEDFARLGGVPIRICQDLREERPNRDPMPQRDFGRTAYALSRPSIEIALRRRVLERANVTLRDRMRAVNLVTDPSGRRIVAVQCAGRDKDRSKTFPSDFVVDASGRGELTAVLLQSVGQRLPEETVIGMDLGCTTAIIDVPDNAPFDWKMVTTHNDAPHSSRRAIMLPIEGNRWMLTVEGFGSERPPGEWDALLSYLQKLTTRTIYEAVKNTVPLGNPTQFGFPASTWRHFERLPTFPEGLIPIGDAICRFNPVYGQGMTVAAKEAVLLRNLLAARAYQHNPLGELGSLFLTEAKAFIETAWTMAALPDLAFPGTRGDRPTDLKRSLQFARALLQLAVSDDTVQKLLVEVRHMVTPASALQDPQLVRRAEAEMARMVEA